MRTTDFLRNDLLGAFRLTAWAAGLLLLLSTAALAQEMEDDEFRGGLIARYENDRGESGLRIDPAIAFDWRTGSPDRRLGGGPFRATWNGLLLSQLPGEYRLAAFVAGKCEMKLAGKTVLSGDRETPGWIESSPIELPFDWHPLQVEFVGREGVPPRLALFWSGPRFQLEPISSRQYFHDPKDTPDGRHARGAELVRALRCAACHHLPGEPPPLAAPDLTNLAGNLESAWLDHLLRSTRDGVFGKSLSGRRMPHFGLSESDATALATFLMNNVEPTTDKPAKNKQPAEAETADAEKGKHLFLTLGCLACHSWNSFGESQEKPFGGGDLSLIRVKRPDNFFARWLAEPARLNADHRMPVFELSAAERGDLAAFLAKQSPPAGSAFTLRDRTSAGKNAGLGKELFAAHRCSACHRRGDTPPTAPEFAKRDLSAAVDWSRACTGEADAQQRRPGYRLSAEDAAAVRVFVETLAKPEPTEPTVEPDGAQLLVELGCVACHSRNETAGLAAQLPRLSTEMPELAAWVPAMTPPPLTGVGDKLHDAALTAALRRAAAQPDARPAAAKPPTPHRPWLLVRMPRFRLSEKESSAIAEQLVSADRIPDGAVAAAVEPPPSAIELAARELAGARLVTSDGFGCTSCHAVGKVQPPNAPLNAKGPDLALLSERIRRPWFDRWIRNPARIVPRMEMPSVQIPVRGVLDEQLDDQLAAVWHVLNKPGFQPPEPNPVRIVRRSAEDAKSNTERAVVLTDVLTTRTGDYVKPLLIGLPNRHNALFDLARGRLAEWWLGDVARQRTKGKSWFWEAGGDDLLKAGSDEPEISLVRDGKILSPILRGQFVSEFESLAFEGPGMKFVQRLTFEDGERRFVIRVVQRFFPLGPYANSADTGISRSIDVENVPSEYGVRLRVLSEARRSAAISADGRTLTLPEPGESRIRMDEPAESIAADGSLVIAAARRSGPARFRLFYVTWLPVDRFPALISSPPKSTAATMDIVPGFDAVRLPVSDEIMPTGLAWRDDDKLILCDLKGRVFLAEDSDGDGLEDRLTVLTDGLAAPYGLAAGPSSIDVINKYGLLRLAEAADRRSVDRIELLASGWGHTADYHDWAVGLVGDGSGGYFIALPCQQDSRSAAAAKWRGSLLRLTPREPTHDDPRRFEPREFTAGHRFPMGLARNRDGELFVTDNQGNYNPFNELNHVVSGAWYGFVNANEKGRQQHPPLTPPAIDIPHPWTRSVNGICFLNSPNGTDRNFGPFEGHLIGCEYDTRRLIRMSLQKVGDAYQGAAYPFTREPPAKSENLLGPLVCAVSPRGDLLVGNIRDSGWGGANNIGSLVRMSFDPSRLPAGIAEIRAVANGFEISFTQPVDRTLAADPANYSVSSYTRVSTPAYGGPDQNRRQEKIQSLELAPDARRATLHLPDLRPDFVYEFQLKNLAAPTGDFFPAEAHFTLRRHTNAQQ